MEQVFTLLGLRDVSSTANARSAVSAKGVAATLCELGAAAHPARARCSGCCTAARSAAFPCTSPSARAILPMRRWTTAWCVGACIPCGLLQSAIRFRRPDVAVTCTEEPQTNVEFSAKFSLRAILIVRAFFHLLAENVRNTL